MIPQAALQCPHGAAGCSVLGIREPVQSDESAWGAVPALLLVRFPRPLAEPAVRVATQRALHGSCRGLVQAAWTQGLGIWFPR
jgi:hypothetical protein